MIPALLDALEADRAEKRATAVVTRLGDGAQALVHVDGLAFDAIDLRDDQLIAVREAIAADRSGRMSAQDTDLFVRVFLPPLRLFIIGGAHIAQDLAAMAARAGYAPVLVDPRDGWANAARFPDTPIIADWPDDALTDAALDMRCAVACLSHDPKLDDPALMVALRSPAFYVGALGGRRSNEKRAARLAEAGLTADEIARLHRPADRRAIAGGDRDFRPRPNDRRPARRLRRSHAVRTRPNSRSAWRRPRACRNSRVGADEKRAASDGG